MTDIKKYTLIVRSITYAMKGQKELEKFGIKAYVERNANPSSRQGCGYGLKIRGHLEDAMAILEAAGITVTEIQEG